MGEKLKGLFWIAASVSALVAAAEPFNHSTLQPFNSYTNHAGYPVDGVPVALDSRTVTLSNATETLTLPLSIFPEEERRRIAADYVAADPDASPTALLVPEPVRQAIAAGEKAIRRSRLRASKGLCTREESDAFCAQTSAALSSWLDAQLEAGAILPAERQALPW